MPVEVIVEPVVPTDEEKVLFRFASATACPNCGAAARCAERTRHKSRKGAVEALQAACKCPLLPRFYAREYPAGVSLFSVGHDGREHRLTLLGGVLHSPQWVPIPAEGMVGHVRVVPDDPSFSDDAHDTASLLAGKGFKAAVAKKPRAKRKKAVAA